MSSTKNVPGAGAALHRVAIAGGGTGGHVHTGVAIAHELELRLGDGSVMFLGAVGGIEDRLVPEAGYSLVRVPAFPIARAGWLGRVRAIWGLVRGVLCARRALREHGVQLVIGVGGYASAGGVLAARSLGLPTVIHEANVRPGLANRLLGRFADRICLGWEATRANFPSGKLRVTGNPIRREIARLAGAPGPGPPEAPYDILVTGGALGSPFLNEHIPELLAAVAARGCDLRVVHQTGETGEPDAVRQRYAKAGVEAEVTPYIEHMEESYRRSVFAIAAAGAGTLAELAACGLPCLLIPLREAAADHQTANARAFSEHTGGRWASGDDWEVDELAAHVAATLTDRERWLAESERMRAADGLGAAREVVDDCQTLMNGSW